MYGKGFERQIRKSDNVAVCGNEQLPYFYIMGNSSAYQCVVDISKDCRAIVATESKIPFFMEKRVLIC